MELTDTSVIALVFPLTPNSIVNCEITPLFTIFFTRLLTADSDNPISPAISTNGRRESACNILTIFHPKSQGQWTCRLFSSSVRTRSIIWIALETIFSSITSGGRSLIIFLPEYNINKPFRRASSKTSLTSNRNSTASIIPRPLTSLMIRCFSFSISRLSLKYLPVLSAFSTNLSSVNASMVA